MVAGNDSKLDWAVWAVETRQPAFASYRPVGVQWPRENGSGFHGNATAQTNMSAESLKKLLLFFDDSQRIRVLEPDAVQRTVDLRDESKDFVSKITEFRNVSNEFVNAMQDMAKQVEKEKIKALGSSNMLQSMTKQRESQQQQYQSLILEKTAELERLRVQHQSLLKIQSEQQDLIQHIQLR